MSLVWTHGLGAIQANWISCSPSAFSWSKVIGSHLVHKHTNIFGGSFSPIIFPPSIQQVVHVPASFSSLPFDVGRQSLPPQSLLCAGDLCMKKEEEFSMALLGEQPQLPTWSVGLLQPRKTLAASFELLLKQKAMVNACHLGPPKTEKKRAASSFPFDCG
jgi:hypothetical protein